MLSLFPSTCHCAPEGGYLPQISKTLRIRWFNLIPASSPSLSHQMIELWRAAARTVGNSVLAVDSTRMSWMAPRSAWSPTLAAMKLRQGWGTLTFLLSQGWATRLMKAMP